MGVLDGVVSRARAAYNGIQLPTEYAHGGEVTPVRTKRGPKTMFDPIAIGRYEDGETAYQTIATEQGPKHVLVQGMTGSGKTDGEKPVLLTAAARGAVQVIVDVRKKTQSYGMIAPILDWLIIDEGLAQAAIQRLADHVIPARTQQLAWEGYGSWHPNSSLKLLRFQVEEAWDFVDTDKLVEISLAARSAGVQLIVSLQRGSHDMMSTALRDQLGTIKCYGLKSGFGATLLDEDVQDAGAKPEKWSDEHPGMMYLQQGGLSLSRKAMPVRAYTDSGRYKFTDVAQQIASRVAACDETTAKAWGEIYKRRRMPMDLITRPPGQSTRTQKTQITEPVTQPVPQSPTRHDDADDADDYDMTTHDLTQEDGDEMADVTTLELVDDEEHAVLQDDGQTLTFTGTGRGDVLIFDEPDPEPDVTYDADEPIADRDEEITPVQFGTPGEKVSRTEFDRQMEERLQSLLEDHDLIKAYHFTDVLIATRWSRGTLYNVLAQWVDDGRLSKIDDGWLPVRED